MDGLRAIPQLLNFLRHQLLAFGGASLLPQPVATMLAVFGPLLALPLIIPLAIAYVTLSLLCSWVPGFSAVMSQFLASAQQQLPHSFSSWSDLTAADATCRARTLGAGANGRPASSINKALDQVLDVVTALPHSSPKYTFARSLAEQILADNADQKPSLLAVNREALGRAFKRTIQQLEVCLERASGGAWGLAGGALGSLNHLIRRCSLAASVWAASGGRGAGAAAAAAAAAASACSRLGQMGAAGPADSATAEKLSRELIWLATKLFDYGGAAEALHHWANSPALAAAAHAAEPRVQANLLKLAASLFCAIAKFNQANEGLGRAHRSKSSSSSASSSSSGSSVGSLEDLRQFEEHPLGQMQSSLHTQHHRMNILQRPGFASCSSSLMSSLSDGVDMLAEAADYGDHMQASVMVPLELQCCLLMLWLPLMCRGAHGADGPVLSVSEKQATQQAIQQMVVQLPPADQEELLTRWLHEYVWSASDWPNLDPQYKTWCQRARSQHSEAASIAAQAAAAAAAAAAEAAGSDASTVMQKGDLMAALPALLPSGGMSLMLRQSGAGPADLIHTKGT